MRVIFFIGQLGLGGGERQLYLLLKGLDKISRTVVCFNREGNYWGKYIEELGVKVFYLERRNLLLRVIQIRKLLLKIKPDVGVSWDIQTNPYLSILSRTYYFKKYFGGVRCNLFREGRSGFERWISLIGITNFIVNSSQGVKHVSLLKTSAKVHLMYNGFEPFLYQKSTELHKKCGITDDLPLILFVGGLKKVKNPKLLLHSFFELTKKEKAHLVFIGSGNLEGTLQEETKSHPSGYLVHFLGQLPGANKFMPDADILVLTSETEGMPGVLIEGGFAGLPLVATNVGGVEDIIVDGYNGFIIDHATHALASRLEELVLNRELRETMGRNSRLRIEEYFTVTRMIKEFERLIEI